MLDIPILNMDAFVSIGCFDEDVSNDDLICEGSFQIKNLITSGTERWIKLDFKNKFAGEVLLSGIMQSIEEYEKEIYQD